MNRVRKFAVTALSAAILAGGVSVSTATMASADTQSESTSTAADVPDAASLSSEQVDHARTIIGVGKGADLSKEAQTIAVMTALQESSLNNLDGGDRDSVGLFQQRPSTGWGTSDQATDSEFASKSFYGVNPEGQNPGLTQIDGWKDMAPGEAAQAVQRSAYPDEYAKWEKTADQLVDDNQDVDDID